MDNEEKRSRTLRIIGGICIAVGLVCLVSYRCSDSLAIEIALVALAFTFILSGAITLINPDILEEFRPDKNHRD